MDNGKEEKNILFLFLHRALGLVPFSAVEECSPEVFHAMMKLARRHEVQVMVAYGMLLSCNLTTEQEEQCRRIVYQAMAYQQRMDQELNRTCALLEEAGLAYMPLKGAVIRKLYPEPWLRTSGDIDILVRDVEKAVELLVNKGYSRKETDEHEVTMTSPGGITLELHFLLIETNPKVNAVLERVWEKASNCGEDCQYEMELEMFYYYHIAHMAKHMTQGGCGIRFFADIWLLLEKMPLNEERKEDLLWEGGLTAFAKQAERLTRKWFGSGEAEDPLLLQLEHFIINGGIFGSKSNVIILSRTSRESSAGYLLRRVFKPFKQMVRQFPVLKRYPVLLPVFWIKRWVTLLFGRRKIRSTVRELSLNNNIDRDAIHVTKRLFQELELF